MLSVMNATYLGNYKLELAFNDGTVGNTDLHDVIFNDHRMPFVELRDEKKFQQFKVAHYTVVWENGLDLAPEFLFGLVTQTTIPDNDATKSA
ncbi:MAG: DUF2442 domain-containing protein [Methylococcaceae bacterium]